MTLATVDPSVWAAMGAAILGGGGVTAFANYRKAGTQSEEVGVNILRGIIAEQRTESDRKDKIIAAQRVEIDALHKEASALRSHAESLERRVTDLQKRIDSPTS